MEYIDLHVHSTASDGSYTPSELVDYAVKKHLKAFALTDHDTCDGIDEAITYAASLNNPVTVIPGIELSAEYLGEDVHILGLNIDYKNPTFLTELKTFQDSRNNRNSKMIKVLNDNGFAITQDMVDKRFGNSIITRAHYAILMIELGYVSDKEEAFSKYLNKGCPCYIPRHKVTPANAVELIKSAKGHPVMAHPVLYDFSEDTLEHLVEDLSEKGLEGIEAIYPLNTPKDDKEYFELAARHNLYVTGGSDFHGTAKPGLELGTGYGSLYVPAKILENIMERVD
ncbi:MAG: PHP domain-containing protein [Lachnospiraceae bacterium]|nr:PHP domain-containing protein [Lachnospiraceae bacterium]